MPAENLLSVPEIDARLRETAPLWCYGDGYISRVFKTPHWKASLLLTNAIGFLAEATWHHPDLMVSWGSVEVRLTTHSAGGVTDKDLALAGEIDRLIGWRPSGESALDGVPDDPEWQYLAPD